MSQQIDLTEHYNSALGFLDLEVQEAQLLEGNRLQFFKDRYFPAFDPRDIFFTDSNVILTDDEDFDKFMEFVSSGCDIVFKLTSPRLGHHIFIIEYINNAELVRILGD